MNWISVKDKLPNPEIQSVLCIIEDGIQHTAHYCNDIEEWIVGGWENCYYCGGRSKVRFFRKGDATDKNRFEFATHWMPLPEPPN